MDDFHVELICFMESYLLIIHSFMYLPSLFFFWGGGPISFGELFFCSPLLCTSGRRLMRLPVPLAACSGWARNSEIREKENRNEGGKEWEYTNVLHTEI